MNLTQWAQQFRLVDEQGHSTVRVRLLDPDGEPWHTWEADELKDSQWPEHAGTYLASLALDLSPGRRSVEFIALDGMGAVRSRLRQVIVGQATGKRAQPGDEMRAMTQSFDALQRTMARMLELQSEQLEAAAEQNQKILERNNQLIAQLVAERELNSASKTGELLSGLVSHVQPQLGAILEMVPDIMKIYVQKNQQPPRALRPVPNGATKP